MVLCLRQYRLSEVREVERDLDIDLSTWAHRQTHFVQIKLQNYVGSVPTYCATVRLNIVTLVTRALGTFIPYVLRLSLVELEARTERTGRTDRRTDEQDT